MIEYRVKPVTRYVVMRYEENENGAGVEECGEFDNKDVAFAVAYALCAEEHRQAGTEVGDPDFQYPQEEPDVDVVTRRKLGCGTSGAISQSRPQQPPATI